MSEDNSIKYLAKCLDPVHIGTGGYRLGRVDMSIVREPATGIPKIPGTSIAGAIRAYAEMSKKEKDGLPDIDIVFGTTDGDRIKQGMLRFYDAEIALFPVRSQLGTVWISTLERLKDWFQLSTDGEEIALPEELQDEDKVIALKGMDDSKPIHLGWLLLETVKKEADIKIQLPQKLSFMKRLVLVSDKLFHHLVNDNLEVRTSVHIDDETGAAQTGGLFTYEAIPRSTVLGFEVAIDSRRGNGVTAKGEKSSVSSNDVEKLLQKAFDILKVLGIGGMGTRGFGRIEASALKEGNGKND